MIFRGAPSGTEFDTTTPHSPKQLYTYIYISFDSTYTFFFYIPHYLLVCRYPITMAPMEKGFSWSNIAVGELAYFIRAPQHPLGLQRYCSLRSAGTCHGDGSVGCISMPTMYLLACHLQASLAFSSSVDLRTRISNSLYLSRVAGPLFETSS